MPTFCLGLDAKLFCIGIVRNIGLVCLEFKSFATAGSAYQTFDLTQTSGMKADHRLRGNASPVLTATGFVNGKGQFSTPHRIDNPQPITKNLSQMITSATPTVAPN